LKQLKIIYSLLAIIVLTIAGLLWFNAYWQVSHSSQLAQIKARGELRVSTLNLAPSYSMDNGVPSGIDYELASLFADYLGVKLVITPQRNISELFSGLEKNDADIIAAALIYNPERMEKFQVGPAYYSVSQQLVYKQGTKKPNNLDTIKNPLTVSEGAAHIATLNYLQRTKHPNLQWQALQNQSSRELLRRLANGTVAYTIADSVTVSAFQRVYPQIAIAFDISEEEPVMWYMKRSKDDSLYAAMLDFFNQVSEDSTLARLEEKYLGHIGGFDYVDARTFVKALETTLPEFQPLFEKHATANIDWRLLAAVSYQESHWNPLATSSTGVRGLMMLTRSTAESLNVIDRLDPDQSVRGGVEYIESLLKRVPKTIPEDERIWFALTAYNMGFGHMQDARRLTEIQKADPNRWADVKQRLPMLTQRNHYKLTKYGYAKGYQAYRYIENIRRYRASLEDYLHEKENREQKLTQELKKQLELSQAYPAVSPGIALGG
jgi:membrane-bound lytic murein transglycosylase F